MGPLDSSVFVEKNLSFSGYCSLFQSQGGHQSTHPIRIRKTACDKGLLTTFLLALFCHRVWYTISHCSNTHTHTNLSLDSVKVKMTNRIIKSTAINSLMFIKLLTHPNKKQKNLRNLAHETTPSSDPRHLKDEWSSATPVEALQFAGSPKKFDSRRIYNYSCSKMWLELPGNLQNIQKKTLQAKQKHFLLQNPSNPFVVKHSVAEQNSREIPINIQQKKVGPDWCQGHQSVRRDPLDFGAWRITEAAARPGESRVKTRFSFRPKVNFLGRINVCCIAFEYRVGMAQPIGIRERILSKEPGYPIKKHQTWKW